MSYILNSDRENGGRDFRSDAVIALQSLNRLLNDSSTEGSKLNDVINELEFIKSSIYISLGVSTTRESDEGRIIISSIDNAIDRGKTVLNSLPYHFEKKKFDGKPVDWFRFLETFEKSVHSRFNYSDSCKLRCLMDMLEGPPLEQIKKLPLIDASYLKALELLKSTFQKDKDLIEAHLYALFDLKSPVATPKSLSEFRDDYEYHIRALKTYESKFETPAGFIIAEILNRKLPKEIRDRVNEVNLGNYWSLRNYIKALNYEIDILTGYEHDSSLTLQDDIKSASSAQNIIPPSLTNESNIPPFLPNIYNIIPPLLSDAHNSMLPLLQETPTEDLRMQLTRKVVVNKGVEKKMTKQQIKFAKRKELKAKRKLNSEKQKQTSQPTNKRLSKIYPCMFCQNGHLVPKCSTYDSPDKRRQRARDLRLCMHCLSKDHSTKKCTQKLVCIFCGGRHKPVLCLRKSRKNREEKLLLKETEQYEGMLLDEIQ